MQESFVCSITAAFFFFKQKIITCQFTSYTELQTLGRNAKQNMDSKWEEA